MLSRRSDHDREHALWARRSQGPREAALLRECTRRVWSCRVCFLRPPPIRSHMSYLLPTLFSHLFTNPANEPCQPTPQDGVALSCGRQRKTAFDELISHLPFQCNKTRSVKKVRWREIQGTMVFHKRLFFSSPRKTASKKLRGS